jgi:signal transduction histidine kinase
MFRIRDKILVTFLSVVIIPIIITGTFFGIYVTKYLKQDKISEFQQSTRIKAEKIIYFIRSIENDLISLGNNVFFLNLIEAMENNDTEQINRCKFEVGTLFRMFSDSGGIYDRICYIDETGHEIVRVNAGKEYAYIVPPEELLDKLHRYYFKKVLKLKEGGVYISRLDLNREYGDIGVSHKPVLRYAIPVFDRKKQNKGIIALNVQADFPVKNVLTSGYYKGVDSYLLDKDGSYLLHPDVIKQMGGRDSLDSGKNIKNDFPQEISSLFLSGQSGGKLVDELFYTFEPIYFDPLDNERYWIFLESLPKSIIYSPIYTFYIIFGVLALLLITGVVTSTFVFSRKLTRPLNELVKGVTTIAERDLDDLDYHINITSNDEIAFLTFSFNKMVYKLGKAKKKLMDYAFNLEKKVENKKEEVFEKAKELKKANKELEDFIYVISHDLKEPLFAIGGYTSRLSKGYKDTCDDKGKFYFDRIKVNIEKMSQKIDEIMEVMKIRRVTYNFRENDSGDIVKDILKTLDGKIKDNKINVIIQDNLPTVLCDERRMKDVLSNLLSNAIKFMGDGNQRQIKIGCDENGDYYKFCVEDTGIGIREEYREQIFKVFKRLNEIKAEGSGVGLSIVKKIVEQHKGKIWIESPVKDGRGSRFCFTIPISRRVDNVKPESANLHKNTLKTFGG